MAPLVVSVRPWRVAVQLDMLPYQFEPVGWLLDHDKAMLNRLDFPIEAVVEVRFPAGAKGQVALLGGRLTPADRDDVELAIGHSGATPIFATAPLIGLLGNVMLPGLPAEYVPGVIEGLTGDRCPLSPGRLEIIAGAHDMVDSSHYAFQRAGTLLRFTLSRLSEGKPWEDQVVAEFVGRWRR